MKIFFCKNRIFFIPKRDFFIPSKMISYPQKNENFFHTLIQKFHTLKTFFIPLYKSFIPCQDIFHTLKKQFHTLTFEFLFSYLKTFSYSYTKISYLVKTFFIPLNFYFHTFLDFTFLIIPKWYENVAQGMKKAHLGMKQMPRV